MVQSLEKALQAKQKEVLAFQQKYNIRIRGEGIGEQAARDDAAAAAGNSSSTTTSAQKQGILVD